MYYEKGHFYSKSNWLFNFRVMVVNKMCLQLPKSKQSISKKEIIYFFEQFGLISEELENWSSLKGLFTFWTLYVYIHILSKEKQSEKDEIFKVEKSNEKRFSIQMAISFFHRLKLDTLVHEWNGIKLTKEAKS